MGTELDPELSEQYPEAFISETAGWFESHDLWSIVSMACYSRAMISARQHQQMLLFSQAVDVSEQVGRRRQQDLEVYERMLAVPTVAETSRGPVMVLLHVSMRVRITTQVLPPWAV